MSRFLFCCWVFITLAYWIGYWTSYSKHNYRPVCFVYFEYPDCIDLSSTISCYWGYYHQPDSNSDNDSDCLTVTIDKKKSFFLISREKLIEQANGRDVYLVCAYGKYSCRQDPGYMYKLYKKGIRIQIY